MACSQESEKAGKKAEKLYKSGKYYCSEAVFVVANESLGRRVPDEMVRLASGFPVGIGGAGCVCGALSGGVVALGLEYGRTSPGAKMPGMSDVAKELHDRFVVRHKCTCCKSLIRGLKFGSLEHARHCAKITGEVARDVVELLRRKQNPEPASCLSEGEPR